MSKNVRKLLKDTLLALPADIRLLVTIKNRSIMENFDTVCLERGLCPVCVLWQFMEKMGDKQSLSDDDVITLQLTTTSCRHKNRTV